MSEGIDALLPPEMAVRAEEIGVKKAGLRWDATLALAVLAGAFIGLGALLATTVSAGTAASWPFGVARLLTGLSFSLGLILVVVGGAELFTGNNLLVMARVSGRISTARLLRNWALVYAGNFIGAAGTAVLAFLAGQHKLGGGQVGQMALQIADGKLGHTFLEELTAGVLGNALVCLAVWLSYSARSTLDRVIAVVPPVTAFVAAGFEHSIANMYFFSSAILVQKGAGPSWSRVLLENLLPVTLGNLIGGVLLVGLMYWFIYRKNAVVGVDRMS